MSYYFVYETTNNINGKRYIGYHKTDNLNDGYLGSGLLLQNAIKKHGKEHFTRVILKFFDDADSALAYEKLLVTEDVVNDNEYYNLMPGGAGGDSKGIASRNHGTRKSTEHKKKLSEVRKGKFTGKDNPFYGKVHSDEMKQWFSERQQGELSPVYDHSEYTFVNHLTSETFTGTQYQFRTIYDFDSGNVNRLIREEILSHKGWTLAGNNIPVKGPKPDSKIYSITNGIESFQGSRKEIMEKLSTKNVSRFLTGKTNTCKGWCLNE